jgi:uncharacterized membrane protein (DUF2068 family)
MNLPPNQNATPSRPDGPAGLLPGMAIIALWMLLLSIMGLIGVTTHSLPPLALLLSAAFAAAATGLLRLRRWGWALTLAATFVSLCYGSYMLFRFHQTPMIVMITVNLIFFLYLVRQQVIERLK